MRNTACVELTEGFNFPERVTRCISVQCMPLPASSCWHRKTFSLWFNDLHIWPQPSSKHTLTWFSQPDSQSWAFTPGEEQGSKRTGRGWILSCRAAHWLSNIVPPKEMEENNSLLHVQSIASFPRTGELCIKQSATLCSGPAVPTYWAASAVGSS